MEGGTRMLGLGYKCISVPLIWLVQFQQIKLLSGVSSRGRIKLTRRRRTRYQQFRSSSVVIFKFVWHLHFAFKCLRFDISQREEGDKRTRTDPVFCSYMALFFSLHEVVFCKRDSYFTFFLFFLKGGSLGRTDRMVQTNKPDGTHQNQLKSIPNQSEPVKTGPQAFRTRINHFGTH